MESQYRQIVQFIEQHLKAGISAQQIQGYLHTHGWSDFHITNAFTEHAKTYVTASGRHSKKLSFSGVMSDVAQAIRLNPKAYSACMVYITIFLFGILLLTEVVLRASWSLWALLFYFTATALAINSYQSFAYGIMSALLKAAVDKQKLAALEPLKATIRPLRRIALTNLLWNTIAFAPLILAGLIVLSATIGPLPTLALILTPILILTWFAWYLIVGIRYCLSPVIAQYEPRIHVSKTLKRSERLLGSRGQWIVVLGFILGAVIMGTFLNISSDNLAVVLVQFVATVVVLSYMFGGLAAIYFNRTASHR